MVKSNLERLYNGLLEMYWLENECFRGKGPGGHKCHELLLSREAKRCNPCNGFVKLKESMRLALGQDHDRRGGDPHTEDVVH